MRRRHYQPGIRGNGPGPRTFSWEQVDAFASAAATTWPTGRTPPVQDTVAMLGALVGLVQTFGPVAASFTQDPQLPNRLAAEARFLEPYQVAAGRINHNRGTVTNTAYTINALMLAIAANTTSPAEALTMWGDIGRCVLSALTTIEERYQYAYMQSMSALVQQAQQVQVNTTAGRLTLASGGPPPSPYIGGGLPGGGTLGGLGGLGTSPAPAPTPTTPGTSASLGSQIGGALGQTVGGIFGSAGGGQVAGEGAGALGDLIQQGIENI